MMKIIQSIPRMQKWAQERRARRASIGFVPTMGALHEGHLSLIRAARRRCDAVVVSIFVNPAQFGPDEDFRRYPRDAEGDAALCRVEKADILFMPTADAIYPEGHQTRIEIKPHDEILEGAFRPGHFSGVATIVAKLFQIIQPQAAIFGQKDYQQTIVVGQLVRDLNFPVKIVVGPTVREDDGLAMSSRNRYLSTGERRAARILFKALQSGKALVHRGVREAATVRSAMIRMIRREKTAKIDYVVLAHPESLRPVYRIEGPVVLLLAVWIGQTRLIDNLLVKG
jgi:pantoate--beta-alanine ligase